MDLSIEGGGVIGEPVKECQRVFEGYKGSGVEKNWEIYWSPSRSLLGNWERECRDEVGHHSLLRLSVQCECEFRDSGLRMAFDIGLRCTSRGKRRLRVQGFLVSGRRSEVFEMWANTRQPLAWV